MKQLLATALMAMFFFSCDTENLNPVPPTLPPVESMIVDFGELANATKSAEISKTNWLYSASTVGTWSVILATTFAVPVEAFRTAVKTQPNKIDDLTWQWQFLVEGFTSQYAGRLIGKLQATEVKWEMYITKKGIEPFDEFLWFDGTSNVNGKSGQWILYHSAAFPEKTIQIDWKKEDEKIGEIKYTYVRQNNDFGQKDNFNGSTLTFGLQNNAFDIFVNTHTYNAQVKAFNDTFIEWSSTSYSGHVKAEHFYNDNNWHCWDSQGNDITCN
jgi:hypothetical protein